MNLDSFLGDRKTAAVAGATVAALPEAEVESVMNSSHGGVSGSSLLSSPELASAVPASESAVTKDITPNGTEIAYRSDPRTYWVNGVEAVSVTKVLDLLQKGGLPVWGMRVGIEGVLALFERGHLTTAFDWDEDRERVAVSGGHFASLELVESLMKVEGLTTNDVKNSAADRGDIVHKALESWAKTSKIPNPDDFDDREKGYVEGLAKFLVDADPEPVRSEVMVGSVEHGYAGRYDIELNFREAKRVRLTPKQKWHEVGPGIMLSDCKSSSGVYPSTHFRQLPAYEAARIECGYEPTNGQYVLWVNGEGSYAYVPSNGILEDFLAVLSVYRSDQRMKPKKEKKAA